ncbi:hypothetical protein [Chlorogloeopsis sp. ULAP02]|uniref:hypothetical protein n=1 Tax=Chlorogloeopsis sp. ULAP02 TaxID=3107926 RepID=UPI0031375685
MNNLELFHFHLERAIYILKFQDKQLVEYWIEHLHLSLDYQYTDSLLTAAIFELSATDTDTCHWILDNFSDCQPYTDLLDNVIRFAIGKLIQQGFILGQDFSFTAEGKILLNEDTKNTLIADISVSDNLLLEKVLMIPQQTPSLTI